MFGYQAASHDEAMVMILAINMGGAVTEVMAAAVASNDGVGSASRHRGWVAQSERLREMAKDDLSGGSRMSGARKLRRAAAYAITAERYAHPSDPLKLDLYQSALSVFDEFVSVSKDPVARVEIPYGSSTLPALYVPARAEGRAPVIIHLNGFDSKKEMLYLERGRNLRERNIGLLLVDQPGTGEALRLRHMHDRFDTEIPVSACIDYLTTRADVDADRIGVMGISMGGYYASRAAAFDARLACCVCWGAMWSLRIPDELVDAEGVPTATGERFLWKFGGEMSDLRERLARYTLDGIMEHVKCPILVTHGIGDRLVPVGDAERIVNEARNSPRRDLRIFTASDGTVEHCQMDNITVGVDYLDDWCAEVLQAAG